MLRSQQCFAFGKECAQSLVTGVPGSLFGAFAWLRHRLDPKQLERDSEQSARRFARFGPLVCGGLQAMVDMYGGKLEVGMAVFQFRAEVEQDLRVESAAVCNPIAGCRRMAG